MNHLGKGLRILYLHQHFSPPEGFGNNRSYELAQEWIKLGYQVTILAGSGNFSDALPLFQLYKSYHYQELIVVRLNVRYSHFMPFGRRLISFICFFAYSLLISVRLPKSDIVYASSTPLSVGVLGIYFKWIYTAKLLFETVDLWPDVPLEMGIIKNKKIGKWLWAVENWIYEKSDQIVCLSEGMRDKICMKGIQEEKISVAHNGTNCGFFSPVHNKSDFKQAIGFQKDDFLVLYAGTVGVANQLEFFIDVADSIRKKGEGKVKFLLLGSGNRLQNVKDYALSKTTTNVTFLHSVPKSEVGTYFQASDSAMVVFAPFKILETNSANKFFDYLASGLPVFVNYLGWQKEYLSRYRCGYSETEVENMAERILELYHSPILCKQLSKNARQLAMLEFDRKDIAYRIAKFF